MPLTRPGEAWGGGAAWGVTGRVGFQACAPVLSKPGGLGTQAAAGAPPTMGEAFQPLPALGWVFPCECRFRELWPPSFLSSRGVHTRPWAANWVSGVGAVLPTLAASLPTPAASETQFHLNIDVWAETALFKGRLSIVSRKQTMERLCRSIATVLITGEH